MKSPQQVVNRLYSRAMKSPGATIGKNARYIQQSFTCLSICGSKVSAARSKITLNKMRLRKDEGSTSKQNKLLRCYLTLDSAVAAFERESTLFRVRFVAK